MGKEITLPWTCETANKIKSCLSWLVLITAPISFAYSLLSVYNPHSVVVLLCFVYGLVAGIVGWIIRVVSWYGNDKFPSFKCKTRESMT